ncbi:MAG TPA: ABC transporter permease [Phycisphaerales bacterium]|nr:ABC transporter permease [Phycisphaerales bacterium]
MPGLGWIFARELIRFGRQPSRVIAALGTPVLVWLVLASGFAAAPPGAGADAARTGPYAAYLLPGMAVMVVLFSSIFAAISLIEDRNAGFLQSVLVSPAPSWAIALGKVGAASLLALAQALPILLAAPLTGVALTPGGFAGAVAALGCVAAAISGIGLAAAWHVGSVQGFHGVMNLVLMPMWLLSGAFFPVEGAAGWLRFLMRLNPLTWPSEALRRALLGEAGLPAGPAWAGSIACAVGGLALPVLVIRRRAGAGLTA